MSRLLASLSVLLAASPSYAISIVSLHGGMAPPMASSTVDSGLMIASLSMLVAVIVVRVFRRKGGQQ